MALRMVEIFLPGREADTVSASMDAEPRGGPWTHELDDGRKCVRMLLDTEAAGDAIDDLERRYGSTPGFRLLIFPIHASLPRAEDPEDLPAHKRRATRHRSISREELYAEVQKMATPNRIFFATVVLSTIVVAVGLFRDNAAVIIGAMVIAPLLGPNVALSLAAALGDPAMLKRGVQSNGWGLLTALALTIPLGYFGAVALAGDAVPVEILRRTEVHWSDIVLALAAGSAGALALTTGVASSLVGVMVAVALLPPTAVVGMLVGAGPAHYDLLPGALLLLATNVVCVNIAGTATFRIQGIQPRTWFEADRATRSTRLALVIGAVALGALLVLIVLL